MEALAAVGLAGNVAQFLDFLTKILSESHSLYHSATGQGDQHVDLEKITSSVLQRLGPIDASLTATSTQSQQQRDLVQACCQVALELNEAIRRLGKKTEGNAWVSFRAALRCVWNEDKIRTLEVRLDRLRQEQMANVIQTVSDQQNATVLEIRELSKQFMRAVDEKDDWQKRLTMSIHKMTSNQALYGPSTNAHAYPEIQQRHEQLRLALLHHLRFLEISERDYKVATAHQETFEWVFTQPPPGKRSWASFTKWLTQGDNSQVYWITGKPGSGKSTFIKFLSFHENTIKYLGRWLPRHELVKASFYFWNSGTDMQMSRHGLLRTLVHQCLVALTTLPDLIPLAFRARWNAMLLFDTDYSPWTWSELCKALSTILSAAHNRKFLFLVDGLDECSDDHTELSDFLLGLVSKHKNLKLCVSSRPWVQFEESFRPHSHLVLSDLTYQDICNYVTTKLRGNSGFLELETREPRFSDSLIVNIATKADGVFLWVALVVKSLLEGLTDGDNISSLQERLDLLPPDLEDLFLKILQSIKPTHKNDASVMFQVSRAAVFPPSVLIMSLSLDLAWQKSQDRDLAYSTQPGSRNGPGLKDRYLHLKRRMNSVCKGLLEISHKPDQSSEAQGTVQFLHRTVRDFFRNTTVWQAVVQMHSLGAINPKLLLSEAYLLETKGINFLAIKKTLDHLARAEASLVVEVSSGRQNQERKLFDVKRQIRRVQAGFLGEFWYGVSWSMEYACEYYELENCVPARLCLELEALPHQHTLEAIFRHCKEPHWIRTIPLQNLTADLGIFFLYNLYLFKAWKSSANTPQVIPSQVSWAALNPEAVTHHPEHQGAFIKRLRKLIVSRSWNMSKIQKSRDNASQNMTNKSSNLNLIAGSAQSGKFQVSLPESPPSRTIGAQAEPILVALHGSGNRARPPASVSVFDVETLMTLTARLEGFVDLPQDLEKQNSRYRKNRAFQWEEGRALRRSRANENLSREVVLGSSLAQIYHKSWQSDQYRS